MDLNSLNPKILSMSGQAASIFGIVLPQLVEEIPTINVLSADMSTPAGLDKFKAAHSDRFFNLGIAEQNMVGVGAGLAEEGATTILVAQACFITMRCFEQVRQFSGYMAIPQIYVGISSGFGLTLMGNTHYALEDVALMRTVPGMHVVAPCDSIEAVKAFRAAVDLKKPVYLRLHGGLNIPNVTSMDTPFEIGKANVLREGTDVQLIACGSMVVVAMEVAKRLEEAGIEARVVDMHTVKPLDGAAIRDDVPLTVTIEEHRQIGGLGEAIAAYLMSVGHSTRLMRFNASDEFVRPGAYQYLLEQNGLTPEHIYNEIINTLK